MGFKSRAASKSKRLVPLDIKCNHLGTTEYWCKGCAWIAADMLRREFEELDSKIATLAIRVGDEVNKEGPFDRKLFLAIKRDILNLQRWP